MRQVKHQVRHITPYALNHGGVGFVRNIHDLIDRGGRCKQGQSVCRLGQQTFNNGFVGALRCEQRISHCLRRLLIEVQSRRSEGKVQVHKRGIDLDVLSKRPRQIVRDCRGPYSALCAHNRDLLSDKWRVRVDEQLTD